MNQCGDILFTQNSNDLELPTRSASPWTLLNQVGPWRIQICEPSEEWKGYPFHTIETSHSFIYVLGEGRFQHYALDQQMKAWEGFDDDHSIFRHWNGHSLIFILNKNSHSLKIITNHLGTVHVYQLNQDGLTRFSSYSGSLLSLVDEKRLDWLALHDYFNYGFYIGDNTGHLDLKVFPPATCSTFNSEGALEKQEKYWRWCYNPNHKQSFRSTVDDFAHIFQDVVDDLCQDKIAMPLSGGLDSRSAFAAATYNERLTDKLWNYGYGYTDPSIETNIGKKLCKTRGLSFNSYSVSPYLFQDPKRVTTVTEGFNNITSSRQFFIADTLGQQADFVMAAHWGDVWLDSMLGKEQNNPINVEQSLHKKLYKPGGEWLLENISQFQGKDLHDKSNERIRSYLKEYEHIDDLDMRIKLFKTDHWSHRWACSGIRSYQPGVYPRLCFYDNRLVDFFMSVPTDMLHHRKLQIAYLKYYHPDLASVKWEAYDTNLYWQKYFNSLLVPKRAFKKLKRKIAPQKELLRNWEVQFAGPEGENGLKQYLLEPGLKLHEYCELSAIENKLKELKQSPNGGNGYAISSLLTFSLWLETFF